MKKVSAIYARVSSERQKDEKTIRSQTSCLLEYGKDNGYSIPSEWIFEDDGYSGSTLSRPNLDKLRDLASEGHLDTVLIHGPDRLSRNYVSQVILLEEFQSCGVEVVFLKSVKDDSAEGQLLQQFQGMIAEYERAQILERSRRGKQHKAKLGCVNVLSGAPYGYDYVKKSDHSEACYRINELHACTVRTIFSFFVNDWKSIGDIARNLTEQKIPTKTGKFYWDRSVIWAILKNPAYMGKAAYGKTEKCERKKTTRALRIKGGYSSRNSANKQRPESEWIYIDVPAIISKEHFEVAQERMELNKKYSSKNTKIPTLLQGLLICKDCSHSYYKTSTRTSSRKVSYYRCLGSDGYRYPEGKKKCLNRPIRQDYLDDLIWQHVIDLLENPELINTEIQRRIAESKKENQSQKQQKVYESEIKKITRAIDKLLDAYQEDLLTIDELRNRTKDLRKKKSRLTNELSSLKLLEIEKEQLAKIECSIDEFTGTLREKSKDLNIEEKQKVVRLLVKDIHINKSTLTINHSVPIMKKKLNMDESYLLRWCRHYATLWSPRYRMNDFSCFL
jgi:site-specific DNA recombinase